MRTTMNFKVDQARGFDVMRGKSVLAHFSTLAEANAYARQKGGRYVRYYAEKAVAAK